MTANLSDRRASHAAQARLVRDLQTYIRLREFRHFDGLKPELERQSIMAYAIRHQGQVATASGLDVLAGIWLLISPFVLSFRSNTGAVTNDVVLGIVIGLLAIYRFSSPVNTAWVSWLNVLLGIWVLISPWVLRFSGLHTATTNNVIMGIIVIILSALSAMATTSSSTSSDQIGTNTGDMRRGL